MKAKRLSILFLIMLLCALILLPGCGVDSSSLGASASMPKESVEEKTGKTADEVAADSEQAEVTNEEKQDEVASEESQQLSEEEKQAIEEEETKLNCTVWLTNTGDHYHLENCRYLKSRNRSLTQKEAIDEGFIYCSKCITKDWLPDYYHNHQNGEQ